MQVAVDPEVGAPDQVVVGVAEARRSAPLAIARVGTAQAGRKVGDDDGALPAGGRAHQLGFEPGPARERLGSDRVDVERLSSPRRLHQTHEIRTGAHRLGATGGAEQIEVAPARAAEDPDAPAAPVGDDQALAFEHRDAELGAASPQRRQGGVEIAAVELVIAGDEDDRLRPAGESLEGLPAAVDVAGEDQQVRAGRGLRIEPFGFEVQVRQQLQPHLSRTK